VYDIGYSIGNQEMSDDLRNEWCFYGGIMGV
jgi:hypothetical protein